MRDLRHDIPVRVEAITGADIFVEETTAGIRTIGAVRIAIVPDATEPGFGENRLDEVHGQAKPPKICVATPEVPIGVPEFRRGRAGVTSSPLPYPGRTGQKTVTSGRRHLSWLAANLDRRRAPKRNSSKIFSSAWANNGESEMLTAATANSKTRPANTFHIQTHS